MKANGLRKLATALCMGALVSGICYELATVEGVAGLLLRLTYGEDTVFTAGYSEAAFRRIRSGATAREVEVALGKPLEIATDGAGRSVWRYSRSGSDTHYRSRIVVLNQNGVVVDVAAEFYID
jgi:hypothetical protein